MSLNMRELFLGDFFFSIKKSEKKIFKKKKKPVDEKSVIV